MDGIAAVEHHIVPNIDTHMGNAGSVICSDEKDEITGLGIGAGHRRTNIVKPLRSEPFCVDKSAVGQDIRHKPEQSKEVSGLEPPQT